MVAAGSDSAGSLVDDEHDGGKPRGRLERMCALTRELRPIERLIRFVLAPDGSLAADLKAVLPGRGVWISASRRAVGEAQRKRVFARALKQPVAIAATLEDDVEALLVKRARDSLSLAMKAGQVVSGFAQVEAALKQGALGLLHARDGAEDGCVRLDRLFRAVSGDSAPIWKVFAGSDLDLALGRSNVVHAALLNGSAAQACLARIVLLSAYRNDGMKAENV